ncbi:MAG: serine/threonine protein kinase [Myxococcales bacterium]|nr:serine/threonine protein kinase [Myxococcales bacterium]
MAADLFGILGTNIAGAFRVQEVIAEGGFGVVYRAEHVAFRAPVALKCLKIPASIAAEARDAFIENFREEAEILFHLSAQIPEVVRPLHADTLTLHDGTCVPFIAMEWIEGRPLDSIVIMREDAGEPPLSLLETLRILTPIAHALNRAHRFEVPGGGAVTITHCDLKPENVIVLEDGPVRAKLLDFGIAKARNFLHMNVGRVTMTDEPRPFTPSYGAPEQWVPKRYGQAGPWTDVWGLAITMVECLTGQPPIDGAMHAMMGTALDPKRRPTPKAGGAKLSAAADAVFLRALAVDPLDRYQDIESFWTELELAASLPSSFAQAAQRRGTRSYDPDILGSAPSMSASGVDQAPAAASSLRAAPPRLASGEFDLELLDVPSSSTRGATSAGSSAGPASARTLGSGAASSTAASSARVSTVLSPDDVSAPPFERPTVPPSVPIELDLPSGRRRGAGDPDGASAGSSGARFSHADFAAHLEADSRNSGAGPRSNSGAAIAAASRPGALASGQAARPEGAAPASLHSPGAGGAASASSSSGVRAAVAAHSSSGVRAAVAAHSSSGVRAAVAARGGPVSTEPANTLRSILRTPLRLIGAGMFIAILDLVVARNLEGVLPIRLRWIGAVLVGIGIMLAFVSLAGRDDD